MIEYKTGEIKMCLSFWHEIIQKYPENIWLTDKKLKYNKPVDIKTEGAFH